MHPLLWAYRSAGYHTTEQVLEAARCRGIPAWQDAVRAIQEDAENSTAMVVVPGTPPGKNVCGLIRRLIADRTKLIVVAQQGPLAPGNFERLLRASMPDVEKKLRIMDGGDSIADAVSSAERNRHYRPSQALEVFCDPQLARNFSQEVRDGSLGFDPTVIVAHPVEIPVDSAEDIQSAVSSDDLAAMHRVLDPHVFSDQDALADYKQALGESVLREFLTDIAPSRELAIQQLDAVLRQELGPEYDDLEYLGTGRNGSAYRRPDGLIVKITTDRSEVESAIKLMGQECEHIYHIHEAFLTDDPNIFLIFQEGGLEKLPPEYCEEFDLAMEILEAIGAMHAMRIGDAAAVRDVMVRSGHQDLCMLVAEVMRKFEVGGMLREVAELGLSADFHSGNIMLREGRPVLTDLGTPGDDPGDVSEATLPPGKPWPDGDSFMGIKGQPPHDKYGFERYRFADVPHDVTVPVGLHVFHGTSAGAEFAIPRGPASFALDRRTAQGYADNEGEGTNPRVLEFVTTRPARCLDHPGATAEGEKAAYWLSRWADENLGKGFTKEWGMIGYARVPDKLAIIQEAGFDGIVVRRLDDGGTEVCLFHPEEFVRPAGDKKVPPDDDMQVSELAGIQSAPAAGPPNQMRGSNSSAWAGGRMVLSKPEQHVPEDENQNTNDALDQDIVGGGLDWGAGLSKRGY